MRCLRYSFAFVLQVCVFLFSCSGQPHSSGLIFGISLVPSSLDPARTKEFSATKILPNIFEPLVQYTDSTLQVRPALAESIDISPDATTWTFFLRTDVLFHDGTMFDAEAVKISFDRQIDSLSPFYIGDESLCKSSSLNMIDHITVLDTRTVRFHLKHPYAPFLHTMATCFGSAIVSPAALQKYGPAFGRHPVGTGPYRLDEWHEEESISLSAYHRHWRLSPKVERIDFVAVPSSYDRAQRILDGSLHIAEDVGATHIDRLYMNPDIKLVFAKAPATTILGFNCQKEPFTDVRVRRAVALAFDKEQAVHTLFRGKGQVANAPLPPLLTSPDTVIGPTPFDPDSAGELLAEAGYPVGFQTDLWCYYSSERVGALPLAIQNDLEKIGVKVNIQYVEDWETYDKGVMNGEAPLFVDGWRGDTADPDSYLYPVFHTGGESGEGNLLHYSNTSVDGLLEQGRRTTDSRMRTAIYDKAQRMILSDHPCVFISHHNEVFAVRDCLKGFRVNPLGFVQLDQVDIVSP